MKKYITSGACITTILLAIFWGYSSCHKAASNEAGPDGNLISSARQFFEENVLPTHNPDTLAELANFRMTLHKTVQWGQAVVKDLGAIGKTIIVPIHFDEALRLSDASGALGIDEVTNLIIYQDSTQARHYEVVTRVPDFQYVTNSSPSKVFSGTVTVENWAGTFLKGYHYLNGTIHPVSFSVIQRTNLEDPVMSTGHTSESKAGKVTILDQPVQTCVTTDWYSCNKDASGELYDCRYEKSTMTCEISWINDGDTNSPVYQYVVSGGGGGGGTSGSGSTAPLSPIDSVNTTLITNPCLNNTWATLNALGAFNSSVDDIVKDDFAITTTADLVIKNLDIADTAIDGETTPVPNPTGGPTAATFTAIIDVSNFLLSNASQEYVAATLFHEVIHAYLDYNKIDINSGNAQHESMANEYVHAMQLALMSRYPTMPSADAYALAWGGLQGTNAWETLRAGNPAQAQSILVTNFTYKYGKKGTLCQ
jgi:hypothetical protein